MQSTIVTLEFLTEISEGKCWMPQRSQVNILDCALPPKMNKLKKLVSDKAKTQGFSEETIAAF